MIAVIISAILFVALLFTNKARKQWKQRAESFKEQKVFWKSFADDRVEEIQQLEAIRTAQLRVIENREYQIEALSAKKKKKPQPKSKRK